MVTTGYTSQPMVETLNEEPFLYPMMRTGANVLLKMFLGFVNHLISLLLEAQDLPPQGTGLAWQEELLEERIGTLVPACALRLVGVEPLLHLSQQ